MAGKVWLEVALNGFIPREVNPSVPIAPEEIVEQAVACTREGAAIVHVHARDPAGGGQSNDLDVYRRIFEGIGSRVDAVVYPTVPMVGTAEERYAVSAELADSGLIEWITVDPGSVNISIRDDVSRRKHGFVYQNPDRDIEHGLAVAEQLRLVPSFAVYEPGFVRAGHAWLHHFPGIDAVVWRLMFSEGLTFGFPPRGYALEAYRALLDDIAPEAIWMGAGLAVDIRSLLAPVIDVGGHVRVGIEDAPFSCSLTNVEWVREAVSLIESCGRSVASASEVRGHVSGRAA